ncbi:transposase, partial [Bowmanella dokdonensis]
AKLRSSLNRLGRKDWIVHCCKRYEHGKGVAIYLARYVRGGPFSRQQLICAEAGRVRFRYQSHRTGQQEVANLPVETFIQRWLMHVPLPGKASIRYLGLYSSAARNRLNQARELLGQMPVTAGQLLQWQDYLAGIGRPACCEICGAPLYQQASLEKEVPRQTA